MKTLEREFIFFYEDVILEAKECRVWVFVKINAGKNPRKKKCATVTLLINCDLNYVKQIATP